MSKSMWIPTEGNNFPVKKDEYPTKSVRVLFWVEGEVEPFWGSYDYNLGMWYDSNAGYFTETQVQYFAYIDNPYK